MLKRIQGYLASLLQNRDNNFVVLFDIHMDMNNSEQQKKS